MSIAPASMTFWGLNACLGRLGYWNIRQHINASATHIATASASAPHSAISTHPQNRQANLYLPPSLIPFIMEMYGSIHTWYSTDLPFITLTPSNEDDNNRLLACRCRLIIIIIFSTHTYLLSFSILFSMEIGHYRYVTESSYLRYLSRFDDRYVVTCVYFIWGEKENLWISGDFSGLKKITEGYDILDGRRNPRRLKWFFVVAFSPLGRLSDQKRRGWPRCGFSSRSCCDWRRIINWWHPIHYSRDSFSLFCVCGFRRWNQYPTSSILGSMTNRPTLYIQWK